MLTEILTAAIICITEFAVIVIASPMAKPSLVLRFLPEDVREVAKNHPEPPLYQQMIAHCLLAVFLLVFLGAIVFLGIDGIRKGYGFWQLSGRFLFVLYLCKLFDILVQDQWLVLRYGYYKKLYPETENCAGWQDRSFNKAEQTKRIVIYPFLCLLLAAAFVFLRQAGLI